VAAATMVGVPKKPLYLPTNYRTHSGILNAAAAVVDVLRHYFSMVSSSSWLQVEHDTETCMSRRPMSPVLREALYALNLCSTVHDDNLTSCHLMLCQQA